MADPESEVMRAREAERAGRLDEALAAYRLAAAADPVAVEPRVRIVGLHFVAGRPADAETEARSFVEAGGGADAYATLGQVLRLTGRPREAVDALRNAGALRPDRADLRHLLNEAHRAAYWSPDGGRLDAIATRVRDGTSTPADHQRFLHLRFAGLMSPEVQRWVVAGGDEKLPAALAADLDRRFDGRFSAEVDALLALSEKLRKSGPFAATAARVTTSSGSFDGDFIDTDSTILGGLELVFEGAYAIVPFGQLRRIEIVKRGPWFTAEVEAREGGTRTVEIPALYLFTDGCRDPKLREGSLTVWRAFRDRFRIGLGLRDFALSAGDKSRLIGLDDVRRVEFR